ncbi:hypothetical protein HY045_03005, partial [Candidatus Woesebacteria bacterium]|nr:hypothetical protein [Candidatus Woesebacteria bacterium]
MRIKKLLTVFLILVSLLVTSFLLQAKFVLGSTIDDLQNKINQLQAQIDQAKSQEKTLSGQISQFDAQISITTLKISQTQEKIDLLTGRIGQLEDSLGSLNNAFTARAVETYKMARIEEPVLLLLTSNNLDIALSRFNYLKRIQADDKDLFERLQKAQTVYKDQKTDAQELQTQLQSQKQTLANQKTEKANLLKITKNNEQRYQ